MMKIFFEKSLKEIQLEKENENYKEKIEALQQENASLKEELELNIGFAIKFRVRLTALE